MQGYCCVYLLLLYYYIQFGKLYKLNVCITTTNMSLLFIYFLLLFCYHVIIIMCTCFFDCILHRHQSSSYFPCFNSEMPCCIFITIKHVSCRCVCMCELLIHVYFMKHYGPDTVTNTHLFVFFFV